MVLIQEENISGKVLDHLGLVAATIEKLKLIEKIDCRLPLAKKAKTTMGQRICAMILNGLGFIDDRLYLFPEFLENKPIDRLFRKKIKAEYFNDDALGRCLDAIYTYGVTSFFTEIAMEIGLEQNLLGKNAHIDTTSLSLYGDYAVHGNKTDSMPVLNDVSEVKDPSHNAIPHYGYSKDNRPDLKQMVLTLATTGACGFPIWMESHSGNASDKKILLEASVRMQSFCKSLKDATSFMTVGDSAIYEACLIQGNMLWLTRVPENHKAAKNLLMQANDVFQWVELTDGYKICVMETQYGDIHQRWAIVYSEQAYAREIKTFSKQLDKIEANVEKGFWHLGNKIFRCEIDAKYALNEFEKKLAYHKLSAQIEPILKYSGKGRPSKKENPQINGYRIVGQVLKDDKKIASSRYKKGRFILATNQMERSILPDTEILSEYKNQSKTESGFKFIKDDAFEVASIFLKKPERISALMAVMTFCLMVYAFAQYTLRVALQAANDFIPDQLKKPTDKPSMKWVYRLFHGVHIITLKVQNVIQEIVINMNEIRRKIVRYFGSYAMQIYDTT